MGRYVALVRLLSENSFSTRGRDAQLTRLRERTRQAAFWAAGNVDLGDVAGCLRAIVVLEPERFGELHRFDEPGDYVRRVVEARAALVDDPPTARPGGRIVAFAPYDSLWDGAAEGLSSGFFDVGNVPPADTWIALLDIEDREGPLLLGWVPEALFELVELGIWGNPESCIEWFDDAEPQLASEIDDAQPAPHGLQVVTGAEPTKPPKVPGYAPTRDAVRVKIAGLLDRSVSRDDATVWALQWVGVRGPQVDDPAVWEALNNLVGADAPSVGEEYLYVDVDFRHWLETPSGPDGS